MAVVAARLMARHDQFGCRIIIIYVDPRHREIFEETGEFEILDQSPYFLVLTTPPPQTGAHD
jgi:hypothetical protein